MSEKHVSDFSLMDPEVMECPYDFYEALHEEEPVYLVPEVGFYIVSKYSDIVDVSRRVKDFSTKLNPRSLGGRMPLPEASEIMEKEGYGERVDALLTTDPPEHTRFRSLVDRVFTASRVRKMEPYIQEIVDTLIDGFIDDGKAEVVNQFSVPVPIYIIADQLGVPREDLKRFKDWSDAAVAPLSGTVTPEREIECAHLMTEMQHYFAERYKEREKSPKDDMLSDLVHAEVGGVRSLDIREFLSVVRSILVAGNETSTNGIGAGIRMLSENPDKVAEMRENPELVSRFTEEVLRLEAPVQGLFRKVLRDTEVGGVPVAKDAVLCLRYGAANRDEDVFHDASDLNLERKNASAHLAFGTGIHHCIGAQLARKEMDCAFRGIIERMDNLRLDESKPKPAHNAGIALRGLKELHILFDKREAS